MSTGHSRPLPDPDSCWMCGMKTVAGDFECDWEGCAASVCRACHTRAADTVWCARHQPPPLEVLGWRTDRRLQHPGRATLDDREGRTDLDVLALPMQADAIRAKSWDEMSRRKMATMVRDFERWCRSQGEVWYEENRNTDRGTVVEEFFMQKLRKSRVTQASSVMTWIRVFVGAFPRALTKGEVVGMYEWAKGLQALAPAPKPVERDQAEAWKAMEGEVEASLSGVGQMGSGDERMQAALWLAVRLQRTGWRPLAAIRASMPWSERIWVNDRVVGRALRVSVTLDKHNAVGAMPVPIRRLIRETRIVKRVAQLLPMATVRTLQNPHTSA